MLKESGIDFSVIWGDLGRVLQDQIHSNRQIPMCSEWIRILTRRMSATRTLLRLSSVALDWETNRTSDGVKRSASNILPVEHRDPFTLNVVGKFQIRPGWSGSPNERAVCRKLPSPSRGSSTTSSVARPVKSDEDVLDVDCLRSGSPSGASTGCRIDRRCSRPRTRRSVAWKVQLGR
jgi:hypothetical protein